MNLFEVSFPHTMYVYEGLGILCIFSKNSK